MKSKKFEWQGEKYPVVTVPKSSIMGTAFPIIKESWGEGYVVNRETEGWVWRNTGMDEYVFTPKPKGE